MILNILYIILALFGIGFLVFIHELGHYFVAKRVGITVLAFSIGFGKPLLEWERKGVKWRICVLPFGGYVQMDGMDKKGAMEPYQIPGGFFAAKPWDRIKVALAGPLANIVFAFFAFAILWVAGGREKPFALFTHHIGWVEKDSGLYEANVRPGDEILQLNGRPYKGFTDFLYAVALDKSELAIDGQEIDYWNGTKAPFSYTFPKDKNVNVLSPAQYLIVAPDGIAADSPMAGSGAVPGDRIVWVDGELVFSLPQLIQVINSPRVLLTVERGGETFLTRVPRMMIGDLRLKSAEKEELDDWRYEAKLSPKVEQLAFIPYNLTSTGLVEGPLPYIDEKSLPQDAFSGGSRSSIEIPLQRGDKIVAIQGKSISSSYQLLQELQTKKSLIVVQKMGESAVPHYTDADRGFEASFEIEQLNEIIRTVGTGATLPQSGSLQLLKPVIPTPLRQPQVAIKPSKGKKVETVDEETFKEGNLSKITSILPSLNRLALNVKVTDKLVVYNPNPFDLFVSVFKETYRTLYALITGFLSPKNISGPVGIIQVMHHSWMMGAKEALFWLGMISLNLAVLNLLPVPVLDGGHILLSAVELVTKKPLKAKTMQRLILPFVILLIGFFVYLTYNDLVRLITGLFQ
ncbi:MAG: RIP metalloprotease RseP [Verrucomicrobia bacterium]|nr:RIP metalloprotease RseP [Verrucomicrobiota bacterium]